MNNIAIFASGFGSNAQRLIEYFQSTKTATVRLLLSNNPKAGALDKAKAFKVPSIVFNREDFYSTEKVLEALKTHRIDYIILAGFLWLVPDNLIEAFPRHIINVHPALLPNYGGKGMYGMKVHEAVIANKEKESGITIHYINAEYDKGTVIFQARCSIDNTDTPETLAQKIHRLEYEHFPVVVEKVLLSPQNIG